MAMMFEDGWLRPKPDYAIFANTHQEPVHVYQTLEWLRRRLSFPIIIVSKGDLGKDMAASVQGGRFAGIPFYTESAGKREGMLRRQCTREYKVEPITKKVRELVGLKKGERAPKRVLAVQYVGISLDEAVRMKPNRQHWIEHRWPLVDAGMRRLDCATWMSARGYPVPKKSACVFCPYHDDARWAEMKREEPQSWHEAVAMDKLARNGVRGTTAKLYLHQSLRPLEEIDFSTPEEMGQQVLWGDECEGMCGV